jgi:hypothetical protein
MRCVGLWRWRGSRLKASKDAGFLQAKTLKITIVILEN